MADHSRADSLGKGADDGNGGASARGGGRRRGLATAIASSCALVFSAVSLYETVLRQPELAIHVAPVIHFTHEEGREALLLPITIANRGARDGTVLSLAVSASITGQAETKTFYSAYVVSSGYFLRSRLEKAPTGGLQITKDRPKVPFAPLNIAGRNSYSGTILFLTAAKEFPRLITAPGRYTVVLTPRTRVTDSQGWLDRLWSPRVRPVTFEVRLGEFSIRTVERGDTIELKDASW